MYIAMNRFKIVKGKEDIFEDIWKNRDSHLDNVTGFDQATIDILTNMDYPPEIIAMFESDEVTV